MVVNLDPKGYDEWLSCSEKKGLKLAPEGSIHNFELAPTFQLHEVGFGILRGRREALHTLPGRFATPILKVVIAEKFQSLRFPEIPTESDASRVNINLPIAEAKFS
jgi:hypothetical protein